MGLRVLPVELPMLHVVMSLLPGSMRIVGSLKNSNPGTVEFLVDCDGASDPPAGSKPPEIKLSLNIRVEEVSPIVKPSGIILPQ